MYDPILRSRLPHMSIPALVAGVKVSSAFKPVEWANFIPPTLKTCVFGFIIGTVSGFFGYTTNEGFPGVQRAATNSVVLSSLLIIVVDVILVKVIFFFFPGQAI
jgi:phospholipid/cholesterol/gamma-HCH transport system permease protein